jgi:creatinine amidohydrolase
VTAIDRLTSPAYGALVDGEAPLVVLVPVGSVEPHGPHLPLGTDTTISAGVCRRAVAALAERRITAAVAPPVGYGVTECAAKFPGAVSIPAATLTEFLAAVIRGYLDGGAAHVCLVNNHLEPAHDAAVRAAIAGFDGARASVACPLERRWARTLSAEFKRGECHAGRYETALVLAEDAASVDEGARADLPEVAISLSEKLGAGITDFVDMGLDRAYAGAPAEATAAEGEKLYARLVDMVVGTVCERLGS